MTAHLPLVLASSSRYRRALLERLGLAFVSASPDIDETRRESETAATLSLRLAETKARALADFYPDHLIIGSDQVATLPDGSILGKPGDHRQACAQLARCSGKRVRFVTGLALLDTGSAHMNSLTEPFDVYFRDLTTTEIDHYLLTETPYDCAGSFRMEGLGIALFSRLEGRDPNSLIGLPLIALTDLLRQRGLNPLTLAR